MGGRGNRARTNRGAARVTLSSATLVAGRAEVEMVSLGEGWLCERDRIFHACGPDTCIALPDGRSICDCGCLAPRHIRQFRSWLRRGRLLVVTIEPPELN